MTKPGEKSQLEFIGKMQVDRAPKAMQNPISLARERERAVYKLRKKKNPAIF